MTDTPTRAGRILLGIGGGIAAYKAAPLVRRLRERGFEVRCALSRSAESFVTPLTLEVLSEHGVYRQEYLSATGKGEESHIVAADWADLLLVAPTTCHLLGRLAQGLADDFLTTTALAFEGPLVLAPAMHSAMWHHAAVQANVDLLIQRGAHFVGPVEGALASGEQGTGRMEEPEGIAEAVHSLLGSKSSLAGRTVLISAGPTHEPIDPVRFLGNRSSGKMGFALAREAASRGARTVLVAGPVALTTPPGVQRIDVGSAQQMQTAMHEELADADLVIMTAAVGDFRVLEVANHKLKKSDGVPTLQLQANPDILAGLGDRNPEALIVGFAAETDPSPEEARAKLERKGARFLVVNDVSRSDIGFGTEDNEVTVYSTTGEPVFLSRRPKAAVARALLDLFQPVLGGKGKAGVAASPAQSTRA